ncbi:hypothetical protein HPP92_026107 [Vanilla planifolia]|uniref:DEUBAD domain-containing protein n=1 Tax=Vanilla planifolia TaxID=51239 RepID=A0A835PEN0_VANPL|nr:hypothetical protein HPP92_026107 [Vanilla planifolia]
MDLAAIVVLQVLRFGEMDHQKSQFYAMHVVQDGGQKVLWQTTPLCMPVNQLNGKITRLLNEKYLSQEQRTEIAKRKRMNRIGENENEMLFCESEQSCIRTIEGDSNRSSSGSAISCSESCANVTADASDWTGSAQSNVCDPLVPVPLKKKKLIFLKPSLEKLTKELYSIWHEQQSTKLSGSLDEDLLFEGETPMGSVEIGNGGVLLRYLSSKTEEESEASSLPVDNKLISEAHSRSASFSVHSESKRSNSLNVITDKTKKSTVHAAQEHVKRDKLSPENLNMLQDSDSPLRFTDLQDVVSLKVFMEHLTNEEQQLLMKFLPSIDMADFPESLASLFSSPQFMKNLSYFQQLLQDGIFDLSFFQTNVEECRTLKRLVLVNLTQSRWVEHYKELKDIKHKWVTEVNKGERGTNFISYSKLKHIKSPREKQNQQLQESKDSMRSPRKACKSISSKFTFKRSSTVNPCEKKPKEMLETEVLHEASCFSPRSLFASPSPPVSMLQPMDDSSEQSLLLDVRGSVFPEAELLYQNPWNQKASSNGSRAESCLAIDQESRCDFPVPRFGIQGAIE